MLPTNRIAGYFVSLGTKSVRSDKLRINTLRGSYRCSACCCVPQSSSRRKQPGGWLCCLCYYRRMVWKEYTDVRKYIRLPSLAMVIRSILCSISTTFIRVLWYCTRRWLIGSRISLSRLQVGYTLENDRFGLHRFCNLTALPIAHHSSRKEQQLAGPSCAQYNSTC